MNTALLRFLLPSFVRRRRDALMRVFAAVLAMAMLASGLYDRPATARADSTCTDLLGDPIPCPPAPLLNQTLLSLPGGLYNATAAQQQSLANLEQQAVTNTIQDHGLASSDAAAVQ